MKHVILLCLVLIGLHGAAKGQKMAVPLGGNSWITTHSRTGSEAITDKGWENWSETDTVFSTYVYLAKAGQLKLAAVFDVPSGQSKIQCTVQNDARSLTVSRRGIESTIGEWEIAGPGYVRIDMKGVSKTGPLFATVKTLQISGSAVDKDTAFVKDNKDDHFTFGRRGPSTHLRYDTSDIDGEIEYFYSEVIVPARNDVAGTYALASGFAEGYFGIQVVSDTERKIMFSVWSPFETDDPSKIPPDKRIVLVRKGKDVVTGEFGNEGSGGQSFLRYNWKAGETYKLLLKAEKVEENRTNYTAWFFSDAEPRWRLIATLSRPATSTYLTELYSFLENFDPDMGNVTRKAFYQNQWVRTTDEKWHAISKATFTYDDTAKANFRLDYSGGQEAGKFYLRICGFFNDNTPADTEFSRPTNAAPPKIDFSKLE